jgi:hypothetical protein
MTQPQQFLRQGKARMKISGDPIVAIAIRFKQLFQ